MPMKTTFDSRPVIAVAQFDRGRAHLLEDLGGGQVALSARPGPSRRTGMPCRSRPATRCTRCCAAGSASAPTRTSSRRPRATASFGSRPRRTRSRATGVSSRGNSASATCSRTAAGRSVICVRVGDQPAVVLVGQLLAAKSGQPQLGDRGGAARRRRGRRRCRGGIARRGGSKTRGRDVGMGFCQYPIDGRRKLIGAM